MIALKHGTPRPKPFRIHQPAAGLTVQGHFNYAAALSIPLLI
jgi:hypothetical protein